MVIMQAVTQHAQLASSKNHRNWWQNLLHTLVHRTTTPTNIHLGTTETRLHQKQNQRNSIFDL